GRRICWLRREKQNVVCTEVSIVLGGEGCGRRKDAVWTRKAHMTEIDKRAGKRFDPAHFLRSQLRNIAPLITLISLFVFFSMTSPSFMTLGNFANILAQVSLTSIIAVGLTFV